MKKLSKTLITMLIVCVLSLMLFGCDLSRGKNSNKENPIRFREASEPFGTFKYISGAGNHSRALDNQGNIWVWGFGNNGELGLGYNGSEIVPRPYMLTKGCGYQTLPVFVSINSSLALDENGNMWSWGNNWVGSLGHGERSTNIYRPRMLEICNDGESLPAFKAISSNSAIDIYGRIWTWGMGHQFKKSF